MRRFAVLLAALGASLLPAAAQTKPAQKHWTVPRTPDGHPDLQGIWTNATVTPLERPADLAGKPFFTDAEAAQYAKQSVERNNVDNRQNLSAEADVGLAYNNAWYDRGTKVIKTHRTSLIIDPADGKIPALTPEARDRMQTAAAERRMHPADGPEDRALTERCLIWPTVGPPMMPSFYNNNYEIVQNAGHVAIMVEMIHDVRMIPTDGSPHLPQTIRQWMGDPRGHWEGDSLVVDTTNFTDKTNFHGSDQNLHLIERFTRVDADTLLYEFTVDDPTAFTKPFTAQIPMTRSEGPIFEYACHEGNYAMADMLRGARAEEKKAAGTSK